MALDDVTRQSLLAALHSGEGSERRERLTPPRDNEMPKDYAPKGADVPGMLDENYGLKSKR